MPEALRRGVVVSLSVLAALVGTSCSSGGDDGGSGPSCTRPAVPTTGPGDTLDYFPNDVGWSWNYSSPSTGPYTWTVTGTQVVGAETASTWSTGELVVKRPSGAYLLPDASVQRPARDLYPQLVLPFPVATTAAMGEGQCTSVNAGDLDGDGKADTRDLVLTYQVLSVTETLQVTAGSFTDVAHVRQILRITNHMTGLGTVPETITQEDWYAPGVGLVSRSLVDAAPPYFTVSDSMQLTSYTPAAAPAVMRSATAEAAPAAAPDAPPFAARGLAPFRTILDAGR